MKHHCSMLFVLYFLNFLSGIASASTAPEQQIAGEPQDAALTLVVDNYPPYIDELAPGQGVLTQLVQQAFSSANIPVIMSFQPWPKVPRVAAQANHASFLWFKTPELEQDWLFSEPIVELRQLLVTTKTTDIALKRFDQLRPFRIGVTKGYFYGPEFAAQRQDFRITEAVSDFASLQNLLAGRVDFALMDPIVAQLMWRQLPVKSPKLHFLAKPLLTAQPAYLVCSRNFLPCHEVIQRFNQALLHLQQTGTDLQIFGFGVNE